MSSAFSLAKTFWLLVLGTRMPTWIANQLKTYHGFMPWFQTMRTYFHAKLLSIAFLCSLAYGTLPWPPACINKDHLLKSIYQTSRTSLCHFSLVTIVYALINEDKGSMPRICDMKIPKVALFCPINNWKPISSTLSLKNACDTPQV